MSRLLKKMLKMLALCVGVVLMLFVLLAGVVVGCYSYQTRTIDHVYATYDEMMDERRARHLRRWLPNTATNIHFASKAKFGMHTDHFSCSLSESEFARFAQEHSYVIATNSFIMLDYGSPEQEDAGFARWRREQMARDADTQRRLVFGGAPAPKNYLSHTESHAFEGGAIGGNSRYIVVFDRDAGRLTGYVYVNGL